MRAGWHCGNREEAAVLRQPTAPGTSTYGEAPRLFPGGFGSGPSGR
jgi:hypothetical protein